MLLALLALFLLSAFFSSAETVLFSLTGAQREKIRSKSAEDDQRIGKCLSDKAVLFSTLLVGNTFVNFAISSIGYCVFDWLVPGNGWIAVPAMTVLLLLFGEITPKRLALRYTGELAPLYSRLLLFWRAAFYPFNKALRWSSKAFAPALARERRALSDDELVSVMDSAAERGDISSADADMIEGVLRLSELCANDEMTPRVDIVGYDIDLLGDPSAARQQPTTHTPLPATDYQLPITRHRWLPAFRRSPDNIEGVYDTKEKRIVDALFVPETVTLDDLLTTFAKSGREIAIVTDEYGGTAGIITPNDILELIIGPQVFDSPDAEPKLVMKGVGVWEVDGRVSLDEINRTLDIELEAEDADRLSGWLQFHAERIPHVGQQIVADGVRATVLKRRHRRVTLVKLEILEHPEADSDEEIIAETDEAVEKTEEDNA